MDWAHLPKTRKEAKEKGEKMYFTGEPCVRGHIAPRKTKGQCIECLNEDWKKDAVKRAEYFAAYKASDAYKAAQRKYYENNKDKVIAKANARDPAVKRQYKRKWKQENPEQRQLDNNVRRRRLRDATPPWLTAEQKLEIKAVYAEAMRKTKETGIKYTVDHIIPINGEDVCGLHVPWNLIPMPHVENAKKGNRYNRD